MDFLYYENTVSDSVIREVNGFQKTHSNKLLGLRVESKSVNGLLDPDSVITNLSSHQLTDIEKMALSRGLQFSLPPTELKKGKYLANFEILFSRLGDACFEGSNDDKLYFENKLRDCAFSSMYNFNSARKHLSNISPEEMRALRSLSKNKAIVVMKPDKGTGIVILNALDYVSKMEQIVLDETKFSVHNNQDLYKVSRSIERKVRSYLRESVFKPGHISKDTYRHLYPNGSHIGVMYGLPKVHKDNCPMRPVCSAVGTSTYQLSKYVAEVIKPAASNIHGTDPNDTFQFLQEIKGLDLSRYYMVSYDVCSLFTNIPLAETIQICLDRLYRSDNLVSPSLPEHVLRNLLELCVKDNIFVFQNKVYYQIDGVAMGNSLGPILANIFMAHLEETQMVNSAFHPQFYKRYVDDTFCLFESRDHATKFLEYINGLHPSIKFEMEVELNNQLEFLDVVVTRVQGSASPQTSTKVKKTDKGLFYNFNTFIPERYKRNKVLTLVYRVYRIASSMSLFHLDITSLKQRLKMNGFPSHFIDGCIEKVLNKYHAMVEQPDALESSKNKDQRQVILSLPYLGPISIILRRNLLKSVRKFYPSINFKVVFQRGFRIANLFSYKDTFPKSCKSMLVYYIACRKCGPSAAYIGKTINTLYERFHDSGTGHLHPNNADSALHGHVASSNDPECSFHFEDVKILETGKYDEQIRFIESILLKYDKQNLNTCERSIKLEIV